TSASWIIRKGTTTAILGKFRVTSIQNATATAAGNVTFEYALQGAAGSPFGAVATKTVTVGSGTVYFDLTAGGVSTVASWDIAFTGYTIKTNGGVSGNGGVMAIPDNVTPFAGIDATYAATAPAQAYRADEFGGVFTIHRWYKYNITGTDNQIWPTFDVYLIRKGNATYKVQLTGYYGTNGASRQITIRYRKIQ
ncbi:MAG: HmuY family protein, partial [Gemmatimonadaceae bacterium]